MPGRDRLSEETGENSPVSELRSSLGRCRYHINKISCFLRSLRTQYITTIPATVTTADTAHTYCKAELFYLYFKSFTIASYAVCAALSKSLFPYRTSITALLSAFCKAESSKYGLISIVSVASTISEASP